MGGRGGRSNLKGSGVNNSSVVEGGGWRIPKTVLRIEGGETRGRGVRGARGVGVFAASIIF